MQCGVKQCGVKKLEIVVVVANTQVLSRGVLVFWCACADVSVGVGILESVECLLMVFDIEKRVKVPSAGVSAVPRSADVSCERFEYEAYQLYGVSE